MYYQFSGLIALKENYFKLRTFFILDNYNTILNLV